MIIISSQEFKDNQSAYLDRIDGGDEIIVQRGENKNYKITPITNTDSIVGEEYILLPDDELRKAITFDELLIGVKEDLGEIYKKGKNARIG